MDIGVPTITRTVQCFMRNYTGRGRVQNVKKFDENGMAVATIATVTGRLHWLINGGHRARINASSAQVQHMSFVSVLQNQMTPLILDPRVVLFRNILTPGHSVSK